MEAKYLVQVSDPHQHIVKVKLSLTRKLDQTKADFYMPSWSPGSYLMREYARNVRKVKVLSLSGSPLYFEKKSKNEWLIDWAFSGLENNEAEFSIEYEIYCHELTVRTSHVDTSHAFLHGPSYLMSLVGSESEKVQIEFCFQYSR